MQMRRLGRDGPRVSAIGIGCMGMSQSYGTPQDEESLATGHRALEPDVNFLDRADVYGPFTNERLVGEAIRGRRDEVILATKCGLNPRRKALPSTAGRSTSARPATPASSVSASRQSTCTTSTESIRNPRSRRAYGPWPAS